MIRRPPRSTQSRSSAASDVYKRQALDVAFGKMEEGNGVNMLQRLGSEPTKEEGNKARAFEINDDGTVSPKEATGLVLGMAFVPPQLPRGYSCLDAV